MAWAIPVATSTKNHHTTIAPKFFIRRDNTADAVFWSATRPVMALTISANAAAWAVSSVDPAGDGDGRVRRSSSINVAVSDSGVWRSGATGDREGLLPRSSSINV